MPPRNQQRGHTRVFLAISAMAHVYLLLAVAAVVSLNPDGCRPPSSEWESFEVALVPEEESEALAQQKLQEELEKLQEELKEEEKKEEEEPDPKGQVVEMPRPPEEKRPDKARFLSEYDSRVKKETKAQPAPFKKGAVVADRPPPRPPQEQSPPPTPEQQEKLRKKLVELAMRARPAPPELPKSELEQSEQGEEAPSREPQERPEVVGPRAEEQQAQEEQDEGRRSAPRLKLSDQELAQALGSRVNDYLEDVEEGEQTLLNSKRFKYATFFNRVKRRVAENWHPAVVYSRRDPSGNVYGFKDRFTVLRVKLDPQGKLMDLHLERPSGVGFLDDEAMSAFRNAEPFPNPPQGLVDKGTGLISFRFGFLFEISSRPSFRIFRGQ